MGPGIMKRHHNWFALGQRLLDATLVVALVPLLTWLKGLDFTSFYYIAAVLGGLLTWVVMGALDAYRPWRGASLYSEGKVLLEGWPVVVGLLLVIGWLSKYTQFFSRIVLLEWFVLAPLAMLVAHISGRMLLRHLRRLGRNYRTAIIIGGGDLGSHLIDRIHSADWMGIRIVGCFDDDKRKQGSTIAGVPVLGNIDDAAAHVKAEHIDMVYIALPMRAEARIHKVLEALQDTTASMYVLPDMLMFQLMDARMQEINGLPVFSLRETPLVGPFGLIKRLEDLVLSSLILLLISPLLVAIAIAVKVTSPGPVLFKQRRYGLNGDVVVVWKFRTMSVLEDDNALTQTKRHDPRVTPLGRILRRTSLDELPQFFNVLQGRMSIVGPRPHAVVHNEQFRRLVKGYMWRHKVKPGITGWAQINGWRGETDSLDKIERRVEYDIEYIRNWSLWLDMKIIVLTILRGFRSPNAY